MATLLLVHSVALLCLVGADQEHVQHGGHVHTQHELGGQHNVEFDHEAILGSHDANDEFSKLSAHDAKKRLALLLRKMDTNGDSLITTNEISDWVLNNFRKQDEEEAAQKLAQYDADGDGRVSWPEYVSKVFGYSDADLRKFALDTSSEMVTFNKMVADEETKFKAADTDKDGALDLEQYSAFLHPQNYEFMHQLEIDRTLADYDKNGDGVISFDEYLGESKPEREQLLVDRDNFNSYDRNSDGHLDRRELRTWVLPDRRAVADEEAEHLLSETDMNRDQKLSFDEILDRHDLWVGSAATDYGQELKHDAGEL